MANILLIETSTRVCSVAIAANGQLIWIEEDNNQNFSHSRLLTVFVEKALERAGLEFGQIDCVAVSSGPGSYTGLRIGVSAAKGFCFGLDKPLVAVDTLKALSANFLLQPEGIKMVHQDTSKHFLLCPMIDARRLEVYTALHCPDLNIISPTSAKIVEPTTFGELLENNTIAFFGDGAAKCREVLLHPNAMVFDNIQTSARGMVKEAFRLFEKAEFADVAYYEPFYLKDFVAGKPKVKGLTSNG